MYDIIIIGAGVAGSYLGNLLMEDESFKDKRILVFDKEEDVVLKDSGIVSKQIESFFDEKTLEKLVKKRISTTYLVSPSGKKIKLKTDDPFVYVLKRRLFGKLLRKNIPLKTEKVLSVKLLTDVCLVETNKQKYFAKVVVAADGANSVLAKQINKNKINKYYGLFSRFKTDQTARIYFNKYYSPDFFSWVVGDEYGLATKYDPLNHFEFFLKHRNKTSNKMYGGVIPTGYLKTYTNNCIILGDAACQVKPLTGGGIINSLICSQIAADVLKKAFRKNDFSEKTFKEYDKRWKKEIGSEIKRGLNLRKFYRKLSNNQIDDLFERFGKDIEREFPEIANDYENLSQLIWKMPKIKLIKAFLKYWKHLL